MSNHAQFIPSPLFKSSYRNYVVKWPKIKKRFEEIFIPFKEQRPPKALPPSFHDHKLSGRLAGLRECHLEEDACLIYSDQHGIVKLILICNHDELVGGREKSLARKIRPYHAERGNEKK